MIKVIYNKVCGRCVQSEPLTSGMVGQKIHFEYSHDFDGLAATAVFTDGANTVNVVNPGNECIIPHEVLTTVGAAVKVGIYAVKGDELVIPTVYATIGFVLKGADPNGGISEDPTLPVWAQTQAMIGNLSELETEAKENLVLAINEVKHTADSKQDAISDLEAIRTGAAKGATALQSVPNTYRTAAAQDVIDSGKVDKVTGKGLSSNDYTDADKAKVDALAPVATSGSYNDLTDKPTIPAPVTEQTVSGWGFTKNTGTYSKPTGGIPKADLANDVQASLDKAETALQEHQSLAAYRTAEAQDIIDNAKQDKLIAGENITIAADGKTISATGGGGTVPKPLTYDYMPEGYPTKVNGVPLLKEQVVAFTISEGIYVANIPNPSEIVEGQTYTVNWDGTEYECVCGIFNSNPVIGNLSIAGGGDDTGEPFLYMYIASQPVGQFGTPDTSASHTIAIKKQGEGIIPMAYYYMPEGYPKKTMGTATVIEEQEFSFESDEGGRYKAVIPSAFEIVLGKTYIVKWDGTEYECVSYAIDQNEYAFGNTFIFGVGTDTGVPFIYIPSYGGIFTLDTSATHTVGVKTTAETAIPMAEEFIPPMNVSAFTNDAGYLTLATLPKYEGVVE